LLDATRSLNSVVYSPRLQSILECKRVHYRPHHAHVVGRSAVHAQCARGDPPEDVPSANNDGQLDPTTRHSDDFFRHAQDGGSVDAERVLAHQGFARKLKEHALVRSGRHGRNLGKQKQSLTEAPRPLGLSRRPGTRSPVSLSLPDTRYRRPAVVNTPDA